MSIFAGRRSIILQSKVISTMSNGMYSTNKNDVIFKDNVPKIGIIQLNRPKALNALNHDMCKQMFTNLKKWEQEKNIVIVTGSEKAFCAGGDVVAIVNAAKSGDPLTKNFFKDEYHLNCLIHTYQIPYIALIHGITMGGGVGISVHAPYRVATEKTLFAMPETAIGFFPDVGGSFFLPRLGGEIGTFLGLTGYRLKGYDAVKAGIATHFCDLDKLEDLMSELCSPNKISHHDDITSVLERYDMLSDHNKNKEFSLDRHAQTINKCFKEVSVEQIIKNLQEDGSDFAKKQIDTMLKMSPLSLKVTLEMLRRGQNSSIQECLNMEYRICQRFCEGHDFPEGVRAVLIDKDNTPKWDPPSLEEVSKDMVLKYFAPLRKQDEWNPDSMKSNL